MAVYDIDGNVLSVIYDIDGNVSPVGYDVDGNLVHPSELVGTLKVMSYNVQRFRGINSQQAMQNEIIDLYEPDLIGMQELGGSTMPTIGANALADYQYTHIGSGTNVSNPTAIISKSLPFSNVQTVKFQNQDPQDMSMWHEERAYVKGDVVVGGKTITFISAHLAYLTTSVKYQQMTELLNAAEQCEYVVITGDFNSMEMSAQADDYINMYKPFVDAGYHLANNSPVAGFQNTFTESAVATSLAELTTAPDSIITSGNINIENVVFDTTKFSYLNGSAIDHIAVIADLAIY